MEPIYYVKDTLSLAYICLYQRNKTKKTTCNQVSDHSMNQFHYFQCLAGRD